MQVMVAAFDPAFGEAWNRRQVEDALLTGNCHYALAFHEGECAGFFLSRTGYDEEELLLLAVAPQYRRLGIAQQLVSQLAQDAAERGAKRLFLEMRQGNPAEMLYRNNGFIPVGMRSKYYRTPNGERLDAITFTSQLA
ncbi:MAG: GNAT family N-acetyltransferase [Novosphingobium sp.]|nr:GNAT family N-acetyltransferase [Novosphingobium sp.]